MALKSLADGELIGLAWFGTSIGAIDLGLVMADVLETMPSEQLFGSGVGEVLIWGYIVAGIVALAGDIGIVD